MNPQEAEVVFRELRASYERINACVGEVFEHGSYAQSIEFRKLAGQMMGDIVVDFFLRIFAEHPHLEPEEFKNAEAYHSHPLPDPTAQSILSAVSELESRLRRLSSEHFAALPSDECAHYERSSAALHSSIALAREFVTRATRVLPWRVPPASDTSGRENKSGEP